MPRTYRGTTEGASSAILGAPFWKEGKSVTGTYRKIWRSSVGDCYQFSIDEGKPAIDAYVDEKGRIVEDGDGSAKKIQIDKFSIGGLKGFQMALDHLQSEGINLEFRDIVTITCMGIQKSMDAKKDDMLQFAIDITR